MTDFAHKIFLPHDSDICIAGVTVRCVPNAFSEHCVTAEEVFNTLPVFVSSAGAGDGVETSLHQLARQVTA